MRVHHDTNREAEALNTDNDKPSSVNSELHFDPQEHAVLLYDLMGQSAKLRQIKKLPESELDRSQNQQLFQATAGAVSRTRHNMQQYYDNVVQSRISHDTLPPDKRALFIASRKMRLAIRNFSDLTVAHVSLKATGDIPNPMSSVVALLGAAASVMLASLTSGAPIRGAIDVGLAVALDGDEIYGPILDEVYLAESQRADWPRIVVGPGFIDYLNRTPCEPQGSMINTIHSGLAAMGNRLIAIDCDGTHIVDYLGPGMKRHLGANVPFALVAKALAFAENERARFADAGCDKLTTRYERVGRYCTERLELWR